jgi:guanylate kinase
MKGTFIIISGLSGAGKTATVARIIEQRVFGARIITCTTRTPRIGEVDGRDYYFLSHAAFAEELAQGNFAEYAKVYGNYYGTLKADIETARGRSVFSFLITDVQGVKTLKCVYPDARSVWIDMAREEFVARLEKRGESPESIAIRMTKIDRELAEKVHFDKVIANKMGRLRDTARSLLRYATRCRRDDVLKKHLQNLGAES